MIHEFLIFYLILDYVVFLSFSPLEDRRITAVNCKTVITAVITACFLFTGVIPLLVRKDYLAPCPTTYAHLRKTCVL